MKKSLSVIILLVVFQTANAQYWFGPKIGINYINPIYQEDSFEDELYDVENDLDFQFGFALNYTATDLYSVYTEIIYERMDRRLTNQESNPILSISNASNSFITIPVMLRVSLGRLPFHYYVNGGPKISYWLASKGEVVLSSFEENIDPETNEVIPLTYKVTFNSKKENGDDLLLMSNPNRLQFGLAAGAGAFFDLATGARLMVDFRYTFGHSNLGFDTIGDSFDFPDDLYVESFEYTMNTLSVSVGYLFGYNSQFKRKGRSTDKESNRKKK
ncbi:MAG: outer membrane beta-barrel protein [Cyclobacteriaceae bacterium]